MLPAQKYHQAGAGAVLAALQEVSEAYGYLPQDALREKAAELGVPFSQLYSAASFYASFSFKPCGKHKLQVCEGTACYVKGASELLKQISAILGIEPDESTDDLTFLLKRVRCVGSCGLAPVVRLDEETFGRVTASQVGEILGRYRQT
jgi:NADH:ubiquinone oxidoreductase subunit E